MLNDELYRMAAADASMLQGQVFSAAGITRDAGDRHVAARALGNALVVVVQEYLEQNSNEHDLELFFEVNGRQPDDIESWPVNILAGLKMRKLESGDLHGIYERAVQTAVKFVQSSSSLAWGR
jgi:hypothetical protein